MNKLRVIKFLPALAVLSLVLIFSSCKKDEPTIADSEQFVSSYDVTDTWISNGTQNTFGYSMRIEKSSQDPTVILLSNFGGDPSATVKGEVSGKKFTIPQQTVRGYGYSGSGTISGSTLSFSYLLNIEGYTLNVSSTATKQ